MVGRASSAAADNSWRLVAGHVAYDLSWPAARQHSVLLDGGQADQRGGDSAGNFLIRRRNSIPCETRMFCPGAVPAVRPRVKPAPRSDNPPFEDGHRREIENGKQESTEIPESPAQAGHASFN